MSGLALLSAAVLVASPAPQCVRELVVLGAGQDAGAPQIGNADDTGPVLYPSSIAVVDRENGRRYLFDATPAITQQVALLDAIEPPKSGLGIDGVFLTHAHIGHYLGLAYLGLEAAGANGVTVYAMPRMAAFLRENGPWSQLVELGNIEITEMIQSKSKMLSSGFKVLPIRVPHRDEYSETVGFFLKTPEKSTIYMPDLDSWDELQAMGEYSLEGLVEQADYVFIDASFWDDNELKGRDMSAIPHPRVKATMERLSGLPANDRAKVHFIHYNHTNPIRDPDSAQSREVIERGFKVARRGDRVCLSE